MPEDLDSAIIEFGNFRIDMTSRELLRTGNRIRRLSERQLTLIKTLVSAGHSVVSRPALYEALGLRVFQDQKHALDVAVCELRRILGDSAKNSRYIEMIPGSGYKLASAARISVKHGDAYDVRFENLLREGGHHWNRRTVEGFKKATDCYEEAGRLYPTDPRPFEGLCVSYLMLATYGMSDPASVLPKFYASHRKAIDFGGPRAKLRVHRAHAEHIFEGKHASAERALLKSMEEVSDFLPVYITLALLYVSQNRYAEALEVLQLAIKVDPLWPTLAANETTAHFCGRNYLKAIESGRRAIADHPHQTLGRSYLAQALEFSGELKAALEQHQICCNYSPDIPWLIALRGCCEAKAGLGQSAEQSLLELERRAKSAYVDPYYRAVFLEVLGRRDEAIAELKRAIREKSATTFIMDVDPKLDSLRSDPRYLSLQRTRELRNRSQLQGIRSGRGIRST